MSVTEISKVYLLCTPLKGNSEHTLYFESREAQRDYFLNTASIRLATSENFNYVRKDGYLKFNANIDSIMQANYLCYQNAQYNNRWFYCFITDMKYINDDTTAIYFKVDVLQTFMDDYIVKDSFIEREHVDNDTFGLHTLDEGLDTGEYIYNTVELDYDLRDTCVIIGSTVDPEDLKSKIGQTYGGIYSGIRYYYYQGISDKLQDITDDTKESAVQSLFVAPKFLATINGSLPSVSNQGALDGSTNPKAYTKNLGSMNMKLEGYTPRNNKLLTSNYNYLLVLNMNGSSAIYCYEYFANPEDIQFKVQGVICPGCSIRMYPLNYKGSSENTAEHINLGKYPQCNWATDQYINWLTQNGVNVGAGLSSSIFGAFGNSAATIGMAASGNLLGAVMTGSMAMTGFSGIANILNQVHLAEKLPPQTSGNINCGDVIASAGSNTYHFYSMSIRKEYAEIIDQFFDMYGYKVNTVKRPNVNHRENWWFTKTVGCNITGAIPQNYLNEIQDIYNRGVTFWKKPLRMYDYTLSNNIVE